MSNEGFEKELASYADEHVTVPAHFIRKIGKRFYDVRQSEIDALIHDNGNMRKAITEYEKENTEARAIINELRVLIQNSLTVDRNAPIWEMVKEFERKYKEPEEIKAARAILDKIK